MSHMPNRLTFKFLCQLGQLGRHLTDLGCIGVLRITVVILLLAALHVDKNRTTNQVIEPSFKNTRFVLTVLLSSEQSLHELGKESTVAFLERETLVNNDRSRSEEHTSELQSR